MNRQELEALVRQLVEQKLRQCPVVPAQPQQVVFSPADRLETGSDRNRVYTHDLYTLEQSPRLGAGVMEITASTFPWRLEYDEIDYVLEGTLEIQCCGQAVRAKQGELLLIPKGSEIHFSAPDYAKFLYFTYPADWQAQ